MRKPKTKAGMSVHAHFIRKDCPAVRPYPKPDFPASAFRFKTSIEMQPISGPLVVF
jgi:hypothetical protein